jgi:hypothetical protein
MWQFEKQNVPPKLFFLTLFREFVTNDQYVIAGTVYSCNYPYGRLQVYKLSISTGIQVSLSLSLYRNWYCWIAERYTVWHKIIGVQSRNKCSLWNVERKEWPHTPTPPTPPTRHTPHTPHTSDFLPDFQPPKMHFFVTKCHIFCHRCIRKIINSLLRVRSKKWSKIKQPIYWFKIAF